MRILFVLLLLPQLVIAQASQNSSTSTGAPGCGPDQAHFDVHTDKHKKTNVQAEPNKALVFFVEEDRHFLSFPKPTTRIGIDGTWVGATHGNSYLYATVEPGERHLCAKWQSLVAIGAGVGRLAAAAHFNAEAGQTYYFRIKNTARTNPPEPPEIELTPLDSDEGKLLTSEFALSTSRSK